MSSTHTGEECTFFIHNRDQHFNFGIPGFPNQAQRWFDSTGLRTFFASLKVRSEWIHKIERHFSRFIHCLVLLECPYTRTHLNLKNLAIYSIKNFEFSKPKCHLKSQNRRRPPCQGEPITHVTIRPKGEIDGDDNWSTRDNRERLSITTNEVRLSFCVWENEARHKHHQQTHRGAGALDELSGCSFPSFFDTDTF